MVAAATFWIADRGGSYGIQPRAGLAIAVWWLIALVVLSETTQKRVSLLALLSCAGLAGLATWTAVSVAWAADDETAFLEVDRVLLYLGVVVLTVLVGRQRTLAAWANGFAFALTVVAVVALLSRLLPTVLPTTSIGKYLPGAGTRLSYPLNYWNGLAVLVALGTPFLLRLAVSGKKAIVRGAAVAPLPAFVAVMYLASSRGGVVAAAIAVVTFLILTDARWTAVTAVAIAFAGALAALHLLHARPVLSDGPFDTAAAHHAGRHAVLAILLICVLVGTGFALATRFAPKLSPPPWLNRAVVAAAVLLAVAGIVASHPVRRFHAFTTPASVAAVTDPSQASASGHFFSESGSGRWQLWKSAVSEWRQAPVIGDGAGAFNPWWLQRNTLTRFVRDAHSIYLQTLAELGIVGLLLLLLAFAPAFVAMRTRRNSAAPSSVAAFGAAFTAFAAASAYDWMWEVTVVSVVALACLGILVGNATAPGETVARGSVRLRWKVAALAAALAIIVAQAVPGLVDLRLQSSEAAVRHGQLERAFSHALAARAIEPWAASPYVQLALVDEARGRTKTAEGWIEGALDRNPVSWTSWLIAARLQTKLGAIPAARRSLHRARELNPRSTIFGSARP
jgi:O-Antigen ligase